MRTPANHYLTINDPHGKQIRATVVYLQPNEVGRSQSAVVHIVTGAWLGPYSYEATYSTPSHSISGRYTLHGYSEAAAEQWLLIGTFDVAAGGAPSS